MPDFCHLHNHTQYSLLDGASDIKKLIKKAVSDEMKAVAITDHGNMFGVFEFVKEAHKKNILPIIGCEFYIVPDRHKKELITGFGNDEDGTKGKKAFHQVLLAKNETGYKNLMKICSLGFLESYYYNPRIDFNLIKEHKEGLIATTCCLAGIIPQYILHKSEEEAEKLFKQWLDVFGEDYYVELQRHGIEAQDKVNSVLVRWANKYNVRMIATNDAHYVDQADAEAQDILLCLQTNRNFSDTDRMRFDNNQFFFKTKKEMEECFRDLPQALDYTMEVVSKINSFDLKKNILLPNFPLPKEFSSNQDYLEHLTWKGAKRRYPDLNAETRERLQLELSIIHETGFAGYFLIVEDFIRASRELGVWVGPGRGSAAGSAVAYCIEITNVDPIKYNLLFERFLNPERVSMPDMDIDFDDVGRSKVIDYVVKKYGQNQVAQIITFGTMGPKTGIRDVARVLGLPLSESNRIAKLIPELPGMKFERAFAEVPELAALRNSPDPKVKQVIRIAETLEGCTRHHGIHAAGIIIAPGDIRDHIPVIRDKDSALLVTQYEGKVIEEAGLLKMDFLGLRTLSILKDAVEDIERNHQVKIDLDKIPLDDPKTFDLFQHANTIGVFQFESAGMRKYLRELKPTHIEDLIAMNALYRPGPMNYIPEYIDRKRGRKRVEYPHPMLEAILKPTYGIMVYQEQIMQVAQVMAGYSLGSADLLRRAMGKKKMEEMQKQRTTFVEGARKKGVEEKAAMHIFSIMEKFAEYGFNRSHSAGYAIIAYQTAYLKANFPADFMAAILSNYVHSTDDTQFYLNEAKKLGIPTLGPDINESHEKFSAKNGQIRYSLSAIKGMGEAAVKAIVEEREANSLFKDLLDLIKRITSRGINKKALESLAAAGAFDCFKENHRAQYFALGQNESINAIEKAVKIAAQQSGKSNHRVQTLFGDVADQEIFSFKLPQAPPWSSLEKLRREKEVTGMYLSGHPLDDYGMEIKSFASTTINDLEQAKNKEASLAVVVSSAENKMARNGKPFGVFLVEDFSGSTEITLFGEDYLKWKHMLVPGYLLFLKGKYQPRFGNDDRFELKLSSVMLMQDLREKMTRNITLQMPLQSIDDRLIIQMESLMHNFTGAVPVNICVTDDSGNVSLNLHPQKSGISLSDDFMKQMKQFPEVEILFNS